MGGAFLFWVSIKGADLEQGPEQMILSPLGPGHWLVQLVEGGTGLAKWQGGLFRKIGRIRVWLRIPFFVVPDGIFFSKSVPICIPYF